MKERDIVNHRNRSGKCFNQREIPIEYIEVWDKVIIDISLEKCFDQWEITIEYIEVGCISENLWYCVGMTKVHCYN